MCYIIYCNTENPGGYVDIINRKWSTENIVRKSCLVALSCTDSIAKWELEKAESFMVSMLSVFGISVSHCWDRITPIISMATRTTPVSLESDDQIMFFYVMCCDGCSNCQRDCCPKQEQTMRIITCTLPPDRGSKAPACER